MLEVLARLPPCSLIRFKCVSKSWRTLIESPEFVALHLKQSNMDSDAHRCVFGAFSYRGYRFTDEFYTASIDSAEKFNITFGKLNCPSLLRRIKSEARIVGSCNGLVCVVRETTSVIFWNPWIRESFELPKSPIQRPAGLYRSNLNLTYGFGYDKATDDYKVVRIAHHPTLEDPYEVKIYSLKFNSWKKLHDLPFSIDRKMFDRPHNGVLSNGASHWIVEGKRIGAIDIRTEEFKLVPEPESLDKNYSWNLGVLESCLCLYSEPKVYAAVLQMWLMKDYGVQNSWTKSIIELPNAYVNVMPIGWCSSEAKKQWVLQTSSLEFLWYDIEDGSIVATAKIPSSHMGAYPGVNSLTSLVLPYGDRGRTRKRIKCSRNCSGDRRTRKGIKRRIK